MSTPASSRRPIFEGVGVALITVFTRDGAVDASATADLAVQLVEAGVDAVLVAGSTGEAAALDPAERADLITAVRHAVPDAIPVLAGTGAPSARQAVRLTQMAGDAGADAALVLSPPRVADPRPYYAAVASACPQLPLLAYHFPAVSSPGIPVEMLAELPVLGAKDSTGDPNRLLHTRDIWPDGHLYVGSSALVLAAGLLGATGVILALANAHPEDCVAAFAGDAQAQHRLAGPHRQMAPFPEGLKGQVVARFGVSATSRMGTG